MGNKCPKAHLFFPGHLPSVISQDDEEKQCGYNEHQLYRYSAYQDTVGYCSNVLDRAQYITKLISFAQVVSGPVQPDSAECVLKHHPVITS